MDVGRCGHDEIVLYRLNATSDLAPEHLSSHLTDIC